MKMTKYVKFAVFTLAALFIIQSCRFFQDSEEYYGVKITTKRNVFVIDISGSMEGKVEKDLQGNIVAEATNVAAQEVGGAIGGKVGSMFASKASSEMTKLAEVKNQLIPAIKGLPEDSYFNIITFENNVERWKDKLIQATSSNKNMAILMIEDLESGGGTNIYGGLEDAFTLAGAGAMDSTKNLNVQTIFFLTDGQPSGGKYTNTAQILEETKKMNPLQRVVINAVGLGKDKDASFLRKLANQNGGTYIDK